MYLLIGLAIVFSLILASLNKIWIPIRKLKVFVERQNTWLRKYWLRRDILNQLTGGRSVGAA